MEAEGEQETFIQIPQSPYLGSPEYEAQEPEPASNVIEFDFNDHQPAEQ